MSDPQSLTDVELIRAIAEHYGDYPEVTMRLYAAADALAVLHRGKQEPPLMLDGISTLPAEEQGCPMAWAVSVQSVAAGDDVKEEICGRPASVPVEYKGELYVVCPGCKEQLIAMGGRMVEETA